MKITLKFLFLVICSVHLLSCGGAVKKIAYNKSLKTTNSIPPEFGKDTSILLVQLTGKNSYDRYIKKHLKNEYGGEYEFLVSEPTEKDYPSHAGSFGSGNYKVYEKPVFEGEHSNREKYRYFLGGYYTVNISSQYSVDPAQRRTVTFSYTYYVLDRKTMKKYYCPSHSSFYGGLFKGYILAIEEIRKSRNEGT